MKELPVKRTYLITENIFCLGEVDKLVNLS